MELRGRLAERDKELMGLKTKVQKLQPFIDFTNKFGDSKLLEHFLTQLKNQSSVMIETPKETNLYIGLSKEKIDQIWEVARKRGFKGNREEALDYLYKQLINKLVKTIEKEKSKQKS